VSKRFERVDRALGRAFSRFWGAVIGLAGLAALDSAIGTDDFSVGTYWPVLGVGTLFLVFAAYLWRSKAGLGQILDETPPKR